VSVYLVGVVPITSSPGLIVDNVAVNSSFLSGAVFASRPWTALLDLYQPKLAAIMFTNDVVFPDPATYQANMQTFCDGVTAGGGAVLFMNFFEQPGRSTSDQAKLRAATKAAARAKGMPCVDLYDLVGDNAATVAAGYMDSSDIHENNAGAVFIAQQAWKSVAGSGVGARLKAA
jgi:hypothetical protein